MSQFPAIIELSSLNGSNGFKISGNRAHLVSGASVSVGDINGDGDPDILIASSGFTWDTASQTQPASYVVYGSASGFPANFSLGDLNGANGFKITDAPDFKALDYPGFRITSGDINGDGYDDVIVSSGFNEAFVVFGRPHFGPQLNLPLLNGANGFKITGDSGGAVATGDLNGDGYADVAVVGNALSVVFGRPSGFTANSAFLPTGSSFTGVGAISSDVAIGDFNGDGYADVLTSSSFGTDSDFGDAFVIYGKPSGLGDLNLNSLNGSNGFQIHGSTQGEGLGSRVANVGDVNGDGIDDFMVATISGPAGPVEYVIFGSRSGFPANFDRTTLNGSYGFRVTGASAWSIAGAGDVNGDGYDDLIIGDPSAHPNGQGSGESYVIFGKASGFGATLDVTSLNGSNGFKIKGAAAGDESGYSVSSAGDLNGDGLADLIVGAPLASPDGLHSGATYVVYGELPTAAVTRVGTDASQNLVGGNLDDVLKGMGGNDHLYGNGGNDVLDGGSGDDILSGGAGTDTATYISAPSGVTVSPAISAPQATGGAGTDTLISIENLTGSNYADTLTGNSGDNVLNGAGGADRLIGGAGNDHLIGGLGQDKMTGGPGNDVFVFNSIAETKVVVPDVITDFTSGQDRINLSAIDADTTTAGDQAFHLGATVGHVGDIAVTYDPVHDRTILDLFVDSDPNPDGRIWLYGNHTSLSAGDFVL